MRRGLWVALGLGLGVGLAVLAVRRLDRAAKSLSPAGVGRLVGAASQLVSEIKLAATQREAELKTALLHSEAKE